MSTYQTGPFSQPQPIPHAIQHPGLSRGNSSQASTPHALPPHLASRPGFSQNFDSFRSEPQYKPTRQPDNDVDPLDRDALHPNHALGPSADASRRRMSVDQLPSWQRPSQSWGPYAGSDRRKSVDASSRQRYPIPEYDEQREFNRQGEFDRQREPNSPRDTRASDGGYFDPPTQHITFATPSYHPHDYDEGYAAGFSAGRRASRTRQGRSQSHHSHRHSEDESDDEGYSSHEDERRRRASHSGTSRRERERSERGDREREREREARRKRRSSENDRQPTIADSLESAILGLKSVFSGR